MKRFIFFSPYLLQIILIPKFMGEDLLNSLLEEARNVKDKFQIIQWQTATRTNIQRRHLINNNNQKKTHTKRPNTAWKWNTIKLHYINDKPTTPRELIKFFWVREKPKSLSIVSFFLFKKFVYSVHSFIGLNMLVTLFCCFC